MGLLTAETTLGGEHFTFCKSCKRLSSLYLTDGGSRKTKLNANEPAASLALGGALATLVSQQGGSGCLLNPGYSHLASTVRELHRSELGADQNDVIRFLCCAALNKIVAGVHSNVTAWPCLDCPRSSQTPHHGNRNFINQICSDTPL